MKAHDQPMWSAIHGTSSGAAIAPTLLPALKIPVANARSRFGNHSAVALIAPGKFADSPRPSAARAMPNALTERARPALIAARLHATIAHANPLRTPNRSSRRPTPRKPIA